eukprot:CAMPEP_0202896784 /NCGR_PEP_ID=MMETSP1392-20130828/5705_1 /ASSEMBLY_ACC=CAM_ASM_000868 /TAXON_ID=225041 /ORGANISM="Chlamydomonas chlamydogama, Strain SAG 11-48b" /LENGTH=262 /DNA_ID=CAMNT_0049582251 /DNA_START=49 /DNA_END=837 /DNA_ORIENTATION=-
MKLLSGRTCASMQNACQSRRVVSVPACVLRPDHHNLRHNLPARTHISVLMPAKRTRTVTCTAFQQQQYSGETVKVLKHAKEYAAAHGSMFVDLDHVIIGLLSTPCPASKLLHGFTIDADHAKATLEASGHATASQVSRLELHDVDLGDAAKDVLRKASDMARAAGSPCVQSSHLASALLQMPGSLMGRMVAARSVAADSLQDKLKELAQGHAEEAAHLLSPEEQVARLKQQYEAARKQGGGDQGGRDIYHARLGGPDDDEYN